MKKRIIALLTCLTLALSLAACAKTEDQGTVTPTPDAVPSETTTPKPTPSPEPSESVAPAVRETVRFAVLSGPTGVGAAKLMADSDAGESRNDYEVTVAADNAEIGAKLISGDLDIAAMASNVAATLYNKNDGGVQLLCLSTLGVLYILERGQGSFTPTVTSLADLAGETIYATGQGANPEYVLDYLLSENGLDPDRDVTIVWQTAQEVQAAMLAGEARFAMLPVPAATATIAQSLLSSGNERQVQAALDLTEEWNKVAPDSVLTMTTVVVRTEFAQEHPEAVEAFLQDYRASIEYVNDNVDEAAELVAEYGIVTNANIAKLAIPDCNLVYIAGEDMKNQIRGYYEVLFAADPSSIGGAIPDDGFYYGG